MQKIGSRMSLSEADSFCSAQLYESDFSSDIEKIWGTGKNRQRVKFETDGGPQSASCKMGRGDENSCKE